MSRLRACPRSRLHGTLRRRRLKLGAPEVEDLSEVSEQVGETPCRAGGNREREVVTAGGDDAVALAFEGGEVRFEVEAITGHGVHPRLLGIDPIAPGRAAKGPETFVAGSWRDPLAAARSPWPPRAGFPAPSARRRRLL